MHEQYLPTGNEWVSLPTLQARTGALEGIKPSPTDPPARLS